ncbi:IS30 family transposase [Rhodanobacter lindaniclasticus]
MGYTHLSQDERYKIQQLRKAGLTNAQVAEALGRSSTTVDRELRRNANKAGEYTAREAHRQSVQRRHAASSCPRIDAAAWGRVEARLREQWSPAQIAGAGEVAISHERIYRHIAHDRRQGGSLWRELRRRKTYRRHRCGTPRERQRFRGRRIEERPAGVEKRWRVGDWEGDTIVGRGTTRLVTLVDRKSGFTRIRRVANGEADTVMRAVVAVLAPIAARVHTLTWDNGSEFAKHELIDLALEAKSYFAQPYASWQRGTNENGNGLIRQYCPKGSDLSSFDDAFIQGVEDKLNDRPRKRLGFRTPREVFERSFKRTALRN